MSTLIKVEGLSKSYGKQKVLENISFNVEAGQIVGLLGPNGSGKTSLIKILSGLINDYSGTVEINGNRPGKETKKIVSYMPEKTYLADWMRPIDAVSMFSDFYMDFDKNKAMELLNRFQLPLKQKAKTMSKGMQEKLQLTLVMCRQANLYLLDEPLGGVDPAARAFILDLIMNNYAENSSVILSTHLINDLEQIFDHALMIGQGKVLLDAPVSEIHESGKSLEDTFKEVFRYAW